MKKQCFSILPYLKTSDPVKIRGIIFRSNSDITSLSKTDQQHLSDIFDMFYLKNDWRIAQMSYAVMELEDLDFMDDKSDRSLEDIHNILAYLYCSPHPSLLDPFLSTEHANLYTFLPEMIFSSLVEPPGFPSTDISAKKRISPDDPLSEIPGYRVWLNGTYAFAVIVGNRIYPSSNHFWLNKSQDLAGDLVPGNLASLNDPLGSLITGVRPLGSIEERLFTALRWYNKSNSILADNDSALLHLAVAFESLLALEQGPNVTQRFKESVQLLSGAVPKLDSWVEQFYKARSSIVHEGSSAESAFIARYDGKRSPTKYRSLVSYGRTIFRICLRAVLSGAGAASEIGLASLLTTNQERFEKVCFILSKPGIDSLDALLSLQKDITEIEQFRFVEEPGLRIDTAIAALRFASAHLVKIKPSMPKNILQLYAELVDTTSSPDNFMELDILQRIKGNIPDQLPFSNPQPFDVVSLAFSLTRSVHSYTFSYYYRLKRERSEADPGLP